MLVVSDLTLGLSGRRVTDQPGGKTSDAQSEVKDHGRCGVLAWGRKRKDGLSQQKPRERGTAEPGPEAVAG